MESKKKNKKQKIKISAGLIMLATGILTGCSQEQDSASEDILISGQFAVTEAQLMKANLVEKNITQSSVSSYELYCVTFSQPSVAGVSSINSEGQFSLRMPANTAFGCFVNDAVSKLPVATVAISAATNEGVPSTSLVLNGSVSLGIINLDLIKGEVIIPRDVIAPVLTPNLARSVNLEDLHNQEYAISCVKTGNPAMDQLCERDMINDEGNSQKVFFRVIEATEYGAPVTALGVWDSQKAFNDCGGIDLDDPKVAQLAQTDGIAFAPGAITTGPAFTVDSILCPLRDDNRDPDHENIRKYLTISKIVKTVDGFTLYSEDTSMVNQSCIERHKTIVHVSAGATKGKFIGQFHTQDKYQALQVGACDHLLYRQGEGNYLLEFKK